MMDKNKALAALNCPLPENDADAATVRDYFKELLCSLLIEEESFSGKRPFGNSGWQHDFLGPLAEAGYIREGASREELTTLFDALVGAL